jgi:hypothetical protein
MAFGELGRVALEVDDLRAVAQDLNKIFGMDMQIHSRAEKTLGILAGVCHDGIELVQRVVPEPLPAKYWKPPLAAVILGVDSLEEAAARMEAAGVELVQTVVTGSGFRELFYGDNFHGVPLVLYQKDEADLVGVAGTGETVTDWSPSGVPPRQRHLLAAVPSEPGTG